MIVAYPHILWLMIVVPVMVWVGFYIGDGRKRRWLLALLRGACLACVVFALSRPIIKGTVKKTARVLVVDLSPSMPEPSKFKLQDLWQSLLTKGSADVNVVAFSNRAQVLDNPSVLQNSVELNQLKTQLAIPLSSNDCASGGCALASALQLAGAQIGEEQHGEITLYSNGLSIRGDAEAEAYRLARRGISIKPVSTSVSADGNRQIIIQTVTAPAIADVGQTVTATVKLQSLVAGEVPVSLQAGATNIITVLAKVTPGINSLHVQIPLSDAGLNPVSARVGTDDFQLFSAIEVERPNQLIVVRQQDDQGTSAALQNILGKSAEIITASPQSAETLSLDDVGAIVLADVTADQFSIDFQSRLNHAVLNGTGLLLTGAARSFGPGGYGESQLAPLLPVKMTQQMQRIDPSTTLVLIIDTSGSMGYNSRIDLAKEVSRLAISHLRPQDKVGIVEFYGGKRWAVPIQSAANTAVIYRALNRLTAGGGTTLYPAVEEAAFSLGSVNTQSKHVLILSDGGVEDAPFAPLVRQMAEDGISVSTVAVAPDEGDNMMPGIAQWGGGRFYSVPDHFELPDITFKEPRLSMLSPMVQTPSQLITGTDPLVQSIDVASWAPVNTYVRTIAKPTADVLLHTSSGDPLLVRWRYGSGFVAALPTQLGSKMTQGLANQPGFATLIADLIRQIASHRGEKLLVHPTPRPAGVEVDVVSAQEEFDADLNSQPLQLKIADASGQTVRTLETQPIDAGRWNVLLPGLNSGTYTISAELGKNIRGSAGIAIPVTRKIPGLTPDESLLARIAEFKALASRQAAIRPEKRVIFIDLRNYLVAGGILFFLLHVMVRRYPTMLAGE